MTGRSDIAKAVVFILPAARQHRGMERDRDGGDDLRRTARTAVRRRRDRGSYDRRAAYAILDEALICAVGFVQDGQPFVLPMVFGRWGDRLVLHAAPASRLAALA